MKHYYVEYCPYGTQVSYDSFNGNAYEFYAFNSKKEREEWLEENEWDDCNLVARAVTRKTVEAVKGKQFRLEDNNYITQLCVVLGKDEI